MHWRSLRLVLVLLLWGGTASTDAGTISLVDLPATGTDAASGINSTNAYVCALGFGGGPMDLAIGGVKRQQIVPGGKEAGADYDHPVFVGTNLDYGGTWSLSGLYSGALGFARANSEHSQADGSLGELLNGCTYLSGNTAEGSAMTLELGGLTPGMSYSLRYYYRQWELKGTFPRRPIEFAFNGEGADETYPGNPLDLDAGGAHYLRYDFTAAASHVTMRMVTRKAGFGPHMYAATLQAIPGDRGLAPGAGAGERGTQAVVPPVSALNPQYEVGSWIWAQKTYDQQTCRLWRAFDIPQTATVKLARLRITADNTYRLFLDGRNIGAGAEWRQLVEYDLTQQMTPGRHVLAVEAFNDSAEAGVVVGLRVVLASGAGLEIASDTSWRVVPNDDRGWLKRTHERADWPPATIIAPFGGGAWQKPPDFIRTMSSTQPAAFRFWQTGWFQVVLLSLCGCVALICLRLMAQLAVQTRAEQYLQRERARIARDIHDDLGARLTQLVLAGEGAQKEFPAESKARAQFNGMCESTREVLGAVDEIVWMVNSRRDTIKEFEMYVCNYAEEFLRTTNIRCRVELNAEPLDIPFDLAIRRNLFLAIKEALNNAARHSGATELILQIRPEGEVMRAVVEDNGKGFNPEAAPGERNGLSNMVQRAAEVGGSCQITSRPGAGCRIEFTTPLRLSSLRRLRWWHWGWWRRPTVQGSQRDALRESASAPPPRAS
jgi:signal transduction histidine kinase